MGWIPTSNNYRKKIYIPLNLASIFWVFNMSKALTVVNSKIRKSFKVNVVLCTHVCKRPKVIIYLLIKKSPLILLFKRPIPYASHLFFSIWPNKKVFIHSRTFCYLLFSYLLRSGLRRVGCAVSISHIRALNKALQRLHTSRTPESWL
jgi:hypothetical protein